MDGDFRGPHGVPTGKLRCPQGPRREGVLGTWLAGYRVGPHGSALPAINRRINLSKERTRLGQRTARE